MKSIAIATMMLLSVSGTGSHAEQIYSDVEIANYYGAVRDTVASYAQLLSPDGVVVEFPGNSATALSVYSLGSQNKIGVPPATLLFLDDILSIQAWYVQNGCDPGSILTYLWGLLNQRQAMGEPYDAFGMDRAATPAQADGPQTPITMFLLAHEIGHLALRHDPAAVGADAEASERTADAFALDRLADAGYNYGGAIADYFGVAVFLDATGLSRLDGVHPVTRARLGSLADAMIERAAGSGDAVRQQRAREEAQRLGRIAEVASPDAMAGLGQALNTAYPRSGFAASCVKP